MVGIGVALVAMTGCGPDPELLERVVRLETQVEDMQAQLAEQAAAAEAPEACAQAKKEAFDAWEAARVVAKKNVDAGVAWHDQVCMRDNWMGSRCHSAIDAVIPLRRAQKSVGGAKQTAVGGAIKAKEAADWAAQHHDDEKLNLTEAIAASNASWEACKDIDP